MRCPLIRAACPGYAVFGVRIKVEVFGHRITCASFTLGHRITPASFTLGHRVTPASFTLGHRITCASFTLCHRIISASFTLEHRITSARFTLGQQASSGPNSLWCIGIIPPRRHPSPDCPHGARWYKPSRLPRSIRSSPHLQLLPSNGESSLLTAILWSRRATAHPS